MRKFCCVCRATFTVVKNARTTETRHLCSACRKQEKKINSALKTLESFIGLNKFLIVTEVMCSGH